MARTGKKLVTRLRKFVNGKPTNETKDNVQGDDHYIEPYVDKINCPPYVAQPTPSPSATPAPAPAATIVSQPEVTTCNECFTEDLPDQTSVCKSYKITNNTNYEAYVQYKNCSTGQLARFTSRAQGVSEINSLMQPYKMYGANVTIASQSIEVDGFVDNTKFHYRAVNCADSNDFRFVKSKTQLDLGKIVKTENSSCCWEIYSPSGPTNAYQVSSTQYDNCADCCTGSVATDNDGLITIKPEIIDDQGNSVEEFELTNTCSEEARRTKVFSIEEGGDIDITFSIEVTAGRYGKTKARIIKIGDGKNGEVWSHPRGGYMAAEDGVETYKKTVRVPSGVFRMEIDPVICQSESGGAEASLTVKIR